jgi:peptidoglycan/LPS O-acetylase OafA/YrhL
MLANGWTAVTMFFILSGFILSYTYTGQIERPRGKIRFWQARFARIYPVYFLSLLLCWPSQSHLGIGLAVAVFTMVQAWNPLHVAYAGAWNMPAWTLSTEAFFYLAFPFLLSIFEQFSARMLKIAAVITVSVIVFGHTMTPSIDDLTRVTLLPLPVFRVPEFLAGMLLGLIYLRNRAGQTNSVALYSAIVSIFAILLLVTGPWISLLALPFTVLIYNLAAGQSAVGRLLGTRSLLLLGGASYAIYLLQEPVRSTIHFAFTGSWNVQVGRGSIDALLSPVILVLFSIAVFRLWEEPARKWLRSRFSRSGAQKNAIAA